ncbi:type III pantothenate kinase [Glaciecola siphonariae]|uniref:Type III pantothenate kinase n=1 Tax=Glaciecola siphonariae TaxID=521012 RepID=A0ABV9M1G2_9ALTE
MLGRASLLIDVGNTNIKYVWYAEGESLLGISPHIIANESIEQALPDLLASRKDISNINAFICSVKSSELTQTILSIFNEAGISCVQAQSQSCQFGLKNSYENVSNMGSDRWLAMLGADAICNQDALVIDAGTAITCDFIVDKQHLGGWIAPGLSLLRKSVVSNTQRVFDFDSVTPALLPGQDTSNCVANGALAQSIGIVYQAYALMNEKSSEFTVFLSGGDHAIIKQYLPPALGNAQIHPNLVLAGLARLSSNP